MYMLDPHTTDLYTYEPSRRKVSRRKEEKPRRVIKIDAADLKICTAAESHGYIE